MPDLISDPAPFHTLDQQQQKNTEHQYLIDAPA